jgi:probable addiction module antidote protein
MMSGHSRSYKEGLHRRLRNDELAANYLQAALEDSQAAFLVALKNVLDARTVAAVARVSKVSREHIYQMLSGNGNPTLKSLQKILHSLGLRLTIGLDKTHAKTPVSANEQSSHPTSKQNWLVASTKRTGKKPH